MPPIPQKIYPKVLLENAQSIEAISELLQAVESFPTRLLTVSPSTLVEMLPLHSGLGFTLTGISMVTPAYCLAHL